MEKPTSKVAYFSKIAEIFSSAKMAQFANNSDSTIFIWLFRSLGIYNFVAKDWLEKIPLPLSDRPELVATWNLNFNLMTQHTLHSAL